MAIQPKLWKTVICAVFITENFNNMIQNFVFQGSLKQAEIKPVYKKESRNEKEN